jgi:ABC-2 type transport system permease protein
VISLLRAETLRLLSRRFTLVALLVVLLGIGAFQIQVNYELTPPTSAEIADAQASFDEVHRDWVENHQEWQQQCIDAGEAPANCEMPEPTIEDFFGSVSFSDSADVSVKLSAYVLALAVFMIAGSYIGAEYSSGSIANWLSFIPRRRLVFASKLVTMVGFALVVGIVVLGLTIGSAAVFASAHDQPLDGLTKVVQLGARSVLLPVMLATLGLCIGLVARHTAAAIGVLLGYLVIWFVRNLMLADVGWAARLTPWAPEANLSALINNGLTYTVPVERITPEGPTLDQIEHHLSLAHSITYWAVLLVAVVIGTGTIFRRRDVS